MERYPEIPRARKWLGLALAGQGQNAEAIEQFRSLVDDGVASPEVHHNLGLLLLSQGDRKGAQEQLEQAVAGRPNLLMAWIYLGHIHKELNQLDFAADFYRRAIEIEPAAGRVYGDLCRVLMAAGKQAESFRYWRHAAQMAGTDQPAEGPARTESDRIALMPIPAPPLTGLEPDIASEIGALQQYFTETVAGSDKSPDTLVQLFATLGQLYHAHKLMDSAEACYLNAARLAPRDFRWRYLLGVLHAQQGSGPNAIDHFLAAARLQPAYEATWLRLGKLQLQRKQLDDARQQFETALTVNADSAAALYGLGQVALAAGDYADAIPRFQAALERAPAADAIHQSLAAAYRELGQQQEADSHLSKKGSVEPPLTDPLVDGLSERFRGDGLKLVRGYVAFNAGRFEDAVEFFARAVQDDPKNARAHVNLGSSLARAGDVDGAIEHYEKALEIDPDRTSAHLSLGVLRADREEFEAAIKHLRAVVKADSLSALASRRLAQALRQDGQDDAALIEYRRLMTIAPDDEGGMLELANLLVRREDFREAIDLLAAANEKNPDSDQTADALARLLASCPQTELRNGERAVELATRAYQSSKREEHAEVLAMALAEAGRCDEAVAIQKKLIAKARKIQNEKIEKRLTEALRRYEQGPPCRPLAPGQKSDDPVPEPETKPDDTDPSDPKSAAEATPGTAQP
jgi:tetratricopeptide (TPR) repeat protein